MNCYYCGSNKLFFGEIGQSKREYICPECGISQRTNDLTKYLLERSIGRTDIPLTKCVNQFDKFNIWEAESSGVLYEVFKNLPNYISSEYCQLKGEDNSVEGKKRIEDIQNLSFPDNTFDIVITQDTFEHIADSHKGHLEIYRVLKKGGFHIFTVPIHDGRKTVIRAKFSSGMIRHILPPIYHLDPLCDDGCLVYTDYGSDIGDYLRKIGFDACVICENFWYEESEIIKVSNMFDHLKYQISIKKLGLLHVLLYNSWIIIARK